MNLRRHKKIVVSKLLRSVSIELKLDNDLLELIRELAPRDPRGFIERAVLRGAKKDGYVKP